MKKILARIYSIYGMIIFCLTAVPFLLPQLLLAQRRSWHFWALRLNNIWARVFFGLCFIRVSIIKRYHPDPNLQYIICANHFSYLDIPSSGLIPVPFKFIGKSSVAKAPIFGYMFRKIHIPVNRENLNSRAMSLKHAMREVSDGFNMIFFPEGGVATKNPPQMVPFRDGAFRLAVNFQLPILPVAIHDNHKIIPDDGQLLFYHHPLRISILDPIFPQSTDEKEIGRLKKLTQEVIQAELDQNP